MIKTTIQWHFVAEFSYLLLSFILDTRHIGKNVNTNLNLSDHK